jgi:hypothetical protein
MNIKKPDWLKRMYEIMPKTGSLARHLRFVLLDMFGKAKLIKLVNKIHKNAAARKIVKYHGTPGIAALADTETVMGQVSCSRG